MRQKIAKLLPLVGMIGLVGCEDNTAECERLLQDKQKQPLAFDYCQKAADQGDATAQLRVAELLFQANDNEAALKYLTKAVNQNHPQALFLMAQRREQNGAIEGATFYYEQSCKLNVMPACEWLATQKAQQVEAEQKRRENEAHTNQQREAKLQAELAAAEQARKEAETKRAEAEKSRLEAERLKQEAEEKARLTEQVRQESESKQAPVSSSTPIASSVFAPMSKTELRQTYSDFVAELQRNNYSFSALETWVSNCYANSEFKKGCFYFDTLASVTDQLLSYEDKNRKKHDYFDALYVKTRAFQNVPGLKAVTSGQLDATFKQISQELIQNSQLFGEMSEVRQVRLANKANATNADKNLLKYEQSGLWGFTDSQGNVVIPAQYLAVGGFYEGRAVVQVPNTRMWGYIDTNGRWVVSPEFCMAGRFSEGLAGAYKNGYWIGDECVGGKWGYLNTSGHWAINPIFDSATMFKNGKAKVTYKGSTGYINNKGNWAQ